MTDKTVLSNEGPKCPYCGYVHTESEDWIAVCTIWGSEDGPIDYECLACGLVFDVVEHVSRDWESSPTVQEMALKGAS